MTTNETNREKREGRNEEADTKMMGIKGKNGGSKEFVILLL